MCVTDSVHCPGGVSISDLSLGAPRAEGVDRPLPGAEERRLGSGLLLGNALFAAPGTKANIAAMAV